MGARRGDNLCSHPMMARDSKVPGKGGGVGGRWRSGRGVTALLSSYPILGYTKGESDSSKYSKTLLSRYVNMPLHSERLYLRVSNARELLTT